MVLLSVFHLVLYYSLFFSNTLRLLLLRRHRNKTFSRNKRPRRRGTRSPRPRIRGAVALLRRAQPPPVPHTRRRWRAGRMAAACHSRGVQERGWRWRTPRRKETGQMSLEKICSLVFFSSFQEEVTRKEEEKISNGAHPFNVFSAVDESLAPSIDLKSIVSSLAFSKRFLLQK